MGRQLNDEVLSGPQALYGQVLARDAIARFILEAAVGTVSTIGGVDPEDLRAIMDEVEPDPATNRVILIQLIPAATAEAIVEQIIAFLAEIARRLWPVWYADADFSICQNNPLGHRASTIIARQTASKFSGVSPLWAEQAAILALRNHPPRVSGLPTSTEIAQLAKVIGPKGLIVVADIGEAANWASNSDALVRALEWSAKYCGGAVVALFAELPPNEAPFDRILYGAHYVLAEARAAGVQETPALPWIAPWRGLPHPFSDIEKRLAKALAADSELGSLFGFNQSVQTVRGGRAKVDLLWSEGCLVVEVDGYESHGNRRAFAQDRHRDYELILSGYTVLRLANDEIAQDCEKALQKIRDLVRLRRQTMTKEV